MDMSLQGNKIMLFSGIEPIRSKIETDNEILEQMNSFTYLEKNISKSTFTNTGTISEKLKKD
jgi:hypothetical protein